MDIAPSLHQVFTRWVSAHAYGAWVTSMVRRAAIALCVIGSLATPAAAEKNHVPWYRGRDGHNRVLHISLAGGLALTWALSGTIIQSSVAGDCRWCEPPGFDKSLRESLKWDNTERAQRSSAVSAYIVAPALAVGLLVLSDHDASPSRLIDDLIPVVETVAIAQILTHAAKAVFSRQRPYAHFNTPGISGSDTDANLSFWSGHSSLGFALTTSAGMIAHWRHYWTEPYIWSLGIASSLATEYFRVAADRHYVSDVLVGGFVGVGAGLLVPRLMRRELAIVPVANGASVVGQF